MDYYSFLRIFFSFAAWSLAKQYTRDTTSGKDTLATLLTQAVATVTTVTAGICLQYDSKRQNNCDNEYVFESSTDNNDIRDLLSLHAIGVHVEFLVDAFDKNNEIWIISDTLENENEHKVTFKFFVCCTWYAWDTIGCLLFANTCSFTKTFIGL